VRRDIREGLLSLTLESIEFWPARLCVMENRYLSKGKFTIRSSTSLDRQISSLRG
jgi:hypothetical protein